MNCTNCGAKVDDRARFCPECGHKLKSDGKTPEKSANDPIKTEPKPVRKKIKKLPDKYLIMAIAIVI